MTGAEVRIGWSRLRVHYCTTYWQKTQDAHQETDETNRRSQYPPFPFFFGLHGKPYDRRVGGRHL